MTKVEVNHFMSAGVMPWPNLPLLSLAEPFIARAALVHCCAQQHSTLESLQSG